MRLSTLPVSFKFNLRCISRTSPVPVKVMVAITQMTSRCCCLSLSLGSLRVDTHVVPAEQRQGFGLRVYSGSVLLVESSPNQSLTGRIFESQSGQPTTCSL
jgi:hypothetical protein